MLPAALFALLFMVVLAVGALLDRRTAFPRGGRLLILFVLTAVALLNLAPLLYMVSLSLYGPGPDGEAMPVLLGPWARLWTSAPLISRWLANSFGVAMLTVLYHLAADAAAGYVLARRRFRGRGVVLAVIIAAMTVPRQVTMIPLYLGMARLGLADTFAGLILPGLGDVVGVFLMRQFFLTLPESLLEAARIDGAGEWQVFRHVALPLARPALGVLAVLGFQHYWSDFFWPLVITQSQSQYTVQVGLAMLARSEFAVDLPLMAAGATLAAIPVLVLFLVARRQFFQGLRSGAIKG